MIENHSKTQFTMSKKEGQSTISLRLNNVSGDIRTLSLTILDGDTHEECPVMDDGVQIVDQIMIPAQSVKDVVVQVEHVQHKIVLSIAQEQAGGGISIRHKNSSKSGQSIDLIELLIK